MRNDKSGLAGFVYVENPENNWFFKKYYYSGSNSRYFSFQIALNILFQKSQNPVIIETGCQRMKEDLGAGMSTSIFGEYCSRYGGTLYTIDLFPQHLDICKACTVEFEKHIKYVLSDSVTWLKQPQDFSASLLYLDSLDYPISPDGTRSVDPIGERAAQEHCLNEFKAAERSGIVTQSTVVLIDDNQLPGGGKPLLLKKYLEKHEWTCLLDLQQSLWVKEILG